MNMRGLGDLNGSGGGSGGGGGGGGGMGMGSLTGGQGCGDCIKGIWNNTPFFVRFLFIASTAIYGLSWLTTLVL